MKTTLSHSHSLSLSTLNLSLFRTKTSRSYRTLSFTDDDGGEEKEKERKKVLQEHNPPPSLQPPQPHPPLPPKNDILSSSLGEKAKMRKGEKAQNQKKGRHRERFFVWPESTTYSTILLRTTKKKKLWEMCSVFPFPATPCKLPTAK